MESKEYNWKEFDEKDFFEVKLKGHIPDFGYISSSKSIGFLAFLVREGFIVDKGSVERYGKSYRLQKFEREYRVLHPFKYSVMRNYGAGPIDTIKGAILFSYKSGKFVRVGYTGGHGLDLTGL